MSTTRIPTSTLWRFKPSSRSLNGLATAIMLASILGNVRSCAMIPSATLRTAHGLEFDMDFSRLPSSSIHSFYRNTGHFANTQKHRFDMKGPDYRLADKSFASSTTAPECTSSVHFSAKHDHIVRPGFRSDRILGNVAARHPRPPKLSRTIELN